MREALERLARDAAGGASGAERGGKRVKNIQGSRDSFHRLRIGDHRIMYDVLHDDRVVLVLGIVHRGELEQWVRRR